MRLFSRATTEACSLPPPPIYFPLTNCSFATSNPSYPAEVTQVDSWGIPVKIASPAQSMCLEPSTVVNNVVIMTQDICTNPENETVAQCASRRGGWLDIATALEDFNGTSINELAPDLEWDILNPPGYAKAARTMIQFPTDIQLDSALVALAGAEAANSSVGQLGLGNDSVILKEMIDAGLSPSNGFAYLAGSQSIDSARNGHLIVGGYDKQSVVGNFTNFALNTTWESARLCPLHVTVTGVMLQRAGKEDEPLITSGASIPACIEPLDTLLRLPQSNLGFFQLVTGWNNGTTISSDLFVVEPGLYYPAPFEGNLTFTLLGGFTVTIPNSELSGPVHGLDPNGKKSLNENITMVNIFYKGAEQETATLGKVFLSQLYLAVDYQSQIFKLAPAPLPATGVLDMVSFNTVNKIICPSTAAKGWRTGAIAASSVLGFLLIIILAGGIYFYIHKRKKRTTSSKIPVIEMPSHQNFGGRNPTDEISATPSMRGDEMSLAENRGTQLRSGNALDEE